MEQIIPGRATPLLYPDSSFKHCGAHKHNIHVIQNILEWSGDRKTKFSLSTPTRYLSIIIIL